MPSVSWEIGYGGRVFPRLLPRQLDVDGAKRLRGIMEEMGFSFRLDAKTEAITGVNQVERGPSRRRRGPVV